MEISTCDFNNIGYMLADVPDAIMSAVRRDVDHIQKNFSLAEPRNKNLAGHILKEYRIAHSQKLLEPFILDLVIKYNSVYNNLKEFNFLTHNIPMMIENPWVNFQKKHEFNPVHNHKGMMSFVIYLQIPYDLKREFEEGPGRLVPEPCTSCFQFLFTNSLGQIGTHTIKVDKSFENKILLFPAKMPHCVYPFYTSDDYRISVAGNVLLDSSRYDNSAS
jgi:hypothetical protein